MTWNNTAIEDLGQRFDAMGSRLGSEFRVNYCPAASVTREQMGVFISVTFGLTLYGP